MDKQSSHGSSLRLPVFWQENTEAWFAITEMRFRLKHVKDDLEKFDHLISSTPCRRSA
jgi:hypothetical protein